MTKSQENQKVAEEITLQLGGYGRLKVMLGAHSFAFDGPSLIFKFKAGVRHNYIKISLNSMDLYDVLICKVVKKRNSYQYENRNSVKFDNVYCDQLKQIFTETTGLALNL